MSRAAFANKLQRQRDQLLREFGYRFAGWDSSGHMVYDPPEGQPALAPLPSTPRNPGLAMERLRRELRRRHPDHPRWRSTSGRRPARSGRVKRRQEALRREARVRAELRRAAERVARERQDRREPVRTPARTCCADCSRVWLSDLDPSGRDCPRCGGRILLGADRVGRAA